MRRPIALALTLATVLAPPALGGDYRGKTGVLPAGTELGDEVLEKPRELFHSEAIAGAKSYLVKLGDLAFNAPTLLGGPAAQARISCGTCHVAGTTNPYLYVPGHSTRPGNFDTTGAFFHPPADNGILDPVTIPSLRGARFLAPYGHDGRIASLREFVRGVIVGEFAGQEPAPAILDAIVAYIQDIDFLPNRRLGLDGKLAGRPSEGEKRGQALFFKPFPHDPALSCAACHMPSAAFVDHRQHDVGSGGLFKTPTLLNANFNAPYFHDGRYDTYAQVVVHFDRVFYLGLSAQDRQDLVAYLAAIGEGERPYEPDSVQLRLAELEDFVSVLDRAIPERNAAVVTLAVDTVGGELRELSEHFPERRDTSVRAGKDERAKARAALKELVLGLRRIAVAAEADRFDEAAAALAAYRQRLVAALPLLQAAEPFSLFNPPVWQAHAAARQELYREAVDPREQPIRVDRD